MYKISELSKEYKLSSVTGAKKIIFEGVDGYDVYNITAPFNDEGKEIIAGRVERRDSEISKIMFFEKVESNRYKLVNDLPTFDLQDPYVTFIDNQLVLGGTRVFEHPTIEDSLWYCASKYKGNSIKDLELFFEGPNGMKDIRLLQITQNKIICFTRPQGETGGRGKVGFYLMNSLEELTIYNINKAQLLDIFIEEEWGGVNEVHKLSDNKVGVLGHIARFDNEGNRHYHSVTFIFDIETLEVSDFNIVLMRDSLPKGDSKRNDLVDVIFSGGLIRSETSTIYVGASDCESYLAEINDPFFKGGK